MSIGRCAVACLISALIACASEERPSRVSTRPRDAGGHDDADASSSGGAGPADGGGGRGGEPMEEQPDAGAHAPPAPQTDGVHVSVGGGAYETASDAFYFETDRPGIQGVLSGGVTVRVTLSEQLGVLRCSDGARVEYEVPEGSFVADSDRGSCTIEVQAFGTTAGAPIEATFRATVERAAGEIADQLELHGRVQVGHP